MFLTKNLSIGYGGHVFLENVQISLDSKSQKRVAIVGKNGSGKSSLIKTLVQENSPLSGSIHVSEETIGYVPQLFDFPEITIEAFLQERLEESWMEYLIDMCLDKVGLPAETKQQQISQLSGGQKMQLKLAETLLKEPTILILDEPTNHLDQEGFAWLQDFLKEFVGSVILISHHRKLLTESINMLWEINSQTRSLDFYSGNYEDWQLARAKKREQQRQQFHKIYDEILEIKEWLRLNEFHPRFRFSDRVMSQKKKMAQLEAICPERPMEDLGITIKNMENEKQKPARLLKFDIVCKTFSSHGTEKKLLQNVSGSVYGNEIIQIIGPNGSGKSTLLKILFGVDTDFEGSIVSKPELKKGWLHQECILPLKKTVYQTVLDELNCMETRAFQILDHYRLKDVAQLKIESISGGQQKKLELAILLEQKPEIIFLDEPTNHLDIFVQEDLEEFLLEEKNITIMFVSHDAYFAKKLSPTQFIELSL